MFSAETEACGVCLVTNLRGRGAVHLWGCREPPASSLSPEPVGYPSPAGIRTLHRANSHQDSPEDSVQLVSHLHLVCFTFTLHHYSISPKTSTGTKEKAQGKRKPGLSIYQNYKQKSIPFSCLFPIKIIRRRL